MADIDLVIKIPEETYRRIQALVMDDYFEHDICGAQMRRIANGMPLPKGHERLIYAKDVGEYLTLADVPTIIEADTAESEDKE